MPLFHSHRKKNPILLGFWALTLMLGSLQADEGLVVHEWGYFVENNPGSLADTAKSLPRNVPNLFSWSPRDNRGGPISAPTILPRLTRTQARQFGGSEWSLGESTQAITRVYGPGRRSESCEPFLYFYSDRKTKVSVSVGFPGGEPLFWWPPARPRQANLRWPRVQVLPRNTPVRFHRWRGDQKRRSGLETARQVASSPIRCGSQTDRYLFYEGSANTGTFLQHHRSWDGLHLRNASSEPLRNLFVFLDGKNQPMRIEQLDPGKERVLNAGETGKALPLDLPELAALLQKEGLYADEALAMARSVFRTGIVEARGTRILYSIGRETYDSIHPLSIQPPPQQIVRVGMVLSFDLDQAIETTLASLGGSRLRHTQVRKDLANQLFDVVASRVVHGEPLSGAMRKALELRTPAMGVLRKIVSKPTRSAKQIESLLAMRKGSMSGKKRNQLEGVLARQMLGHLYSGTSLSPGMNDWLENFCKKNADLRTPNVRNRFSRRRPRDEDRQPLHIQSVGANPTLYR